MHLIAVVRTRTRLFVGAVLVVLLATLGVQSAGAISPHLVISQIYGAGGNANAVLNSDYIELFNRGTAPVSLAGRSLQYTSAAGTGNFGANSGQLTELPAVTLNPGQYFLVQESSGAVGAPLPTPDVVDPTPIAMAAGAGKVALVTDALTLGCNGGSAPCSAAALARITDLVGYGDTANFFEGGGPAPNLSTSLAGFRGGNGCQDTDSNLADFTAATPAPRNTSSAVFECPTDLAPTISARTPDAGATGVALGSNVTITFSEAVNAVGDWAVVACTVSSAHTAVITGGPTTFTLNPNADFAPSESCTVTVVGAQVTDQDTIDPPDRVEGNPSWSFTTELPPPPTREIAEIQGAGHTSPLMGTAVTVTDAIVTAKRANGYYIQDPTPDADLETSDAIFVFTTSAPTSVTVGESVRVSGSVAEFRPGGSGSTNLTVTELTSPTTTVLSSGNVLPPTTLIGAGGRVPPTEVIDDDGFANFDAFPSDGIDFYESLEAMRLQVNNPVVVGPRNSNGEIFVLADNGAGAGVRTGRGGIIVRDLDPTPPGDYTSGDFNPERIQLDDAVVSGGTPNASVGDHFTGPAIGVLDFDFGNFEIHVTSALTAVSDGVTREATTAPAPRELSVATFNVENLAGNEGQGKYDALATQIVNSMKSPDVISLEEIQDNNGATNDSVVDATVTLTRLRDAVAAAGGPTYDWRQINPVDDQDGGQPGGNIRVGFFFRSDRGVAFVDRPGGGSTTPTTIVNAGGTPQLSASPGRVEPGDTAWSASRKPLAGEFTYRGETFFLITNHFNSKGGDNPLFGRFQPPVRTTEAQRHQQATLVNAFVDQILAVDANANVVVLGDLNDFEFSETMSLVEGDVMHALMKTLPQPERYSYVFEGNSQSLDHIVVSDSLFGAPFVYDPVHVNAEFFDQLSDHDPQVARFFVNSAPTADAGGPYSVAEGGSVGLSATGTDANGDSLSYAWDLDNNGTFETAGQSPTFSAASLDGPSSHTVAVRISDGDAATVDQATVNVTNVAPTASLSAPATAFAGLPFTVALTGASDPSAADTAAGFEYAFNCGSGYGAFDAAASATCVTTTLGARSVAAKIRDKDGDVNEYTATVNIIVTFASLCDLVASYSTDSSVTDQLCHKLQQAAAAPTATARAGLLGAFRNDVDAKVGKGLTQAQADVLKELSKSL
jgi:predicted extracellular nuclease